MKEIIQSIIPNLTFKFPYTVEDYLENLYVENYHNHKDFSNASTADCAESIENYAEKTLEYKSKCLFSGDHGNQGNQFEVYKTAEKNKLKYRHSAEAYWVKDRLKEYPEIDKETGEFKKDKTGEIKTIKDRTNCHICLISKNSEGREDLNFALSIANEDGYYYKPRIDLELLFNIPKDNMIVTSSCIAGWKYEDAEDIWLKIYQYFGNNFFLEVQNHDTPSQKILNQRILEMSRKYGIQIICGLDSHYVKQENSNKRDQILKYKGIVYEDEKGWYLDYPNSKEIFARFKKQGVLNDKEILTAMMNTNVFVNECEEIVFDRSFKIPCVYPNNTYEERTKIFKKIINENYKHETLKTPEKVKGIRYEVGEYVDSGVVDYPLTNYHIIHKAVNEKGGILTTTSRGSSASFIVNKLLGFTTIDRFNCEIPIYPERFLTKDRVLSGQMPDIDFNVAIQEPFVEATRELIGEHSCYPLMAIEKLKEKAAWQLYAGANDVKPEVANEISKFIDKYNDKLKYAEEEDKEFIHIEDFIPEEYLEIYKGSLEYQGIAINLKCHACGFLLLEGDIRRKIGLITAVSETTGKRTLCACIEGNYLDEFGYVKNDYLIVDSVHLTYEFFQSIGQNVPSFDELRAMIKDDKATWDIYAKGITCCVNQLEKEATTKKMKQYKAINLAESSAFIAGIRPGFKSLLGTFLARENYTTGESIIDDLLSDSYHFMLYQESIMKLLSFLGVPMGDAYGVIKAISKKKLKGEKLENLKNTLKENWIKIFKNLDNFENIWNVIEDSARYAFNAPHALSMGGDSAYQAWFKAHHTAKFYEVAINHYQNKENKKKIDALIKEALIFYEYKLGDYEFGKDNRRVNVNEQNKIIYPNMSSIKGFGESVSQTLYELGKNEYNNFSDILEALKGTKINKTVIDKLVRLNYFKQFGEVKYLLEVIKWTERFKEVKEISKIKIEEYGLTLEYVLQYGNETAKKITKLRTEELLNDIISNIKNIPLTLKEIFDNQKEILGIITYTNEKYSQDIYYVSDLEVMKSIVKANIYRIRDGEIIEIKMWTNQYEKNQFVQGDFLYVKSFDVKPQKVTTGEINPETGKKIYKEVEGTEEFWMPRYQNITYKFISEVNND